MVATIHILKHVPSIARGAKAADVYAACVALATRERTTAEEFARVRSYPQPRVDLCEQRGIDSPIRTLAQACREVTAARQALKVRADWTLVPGGTVRDDSEWFESDTIRTDAIEHMSPLVCDAFKL